MPLIPHRPPHCSSVNCISQHPLQFSRASVMWMKVRQTIWRPCPQNLPHGPLHSHTPTWRLADRIPGVGARNSGKNQKTEEFKSLDDCREQNLPHCHFPADLCRVPAVSPVGEADCRGYILPEQVQNAPESLTASFNF